MIYPPLEKILRIRMKQVNAESTRRVSLSIRLSVGFSIGHLFYVKKYYKSLVLLIKKFSVWLGDN
jgi:hypothetical protein